MKNKVDPRSKIFIVASLSSLAVIYRDLLELSILFVISFVLALLFKVDILNMLNKLKKFVGILLGITVLQSIFTFEGTRLLYIYDFTILTDYGIIKGAEFILRMGIILTLGILLSTSNQREVTQALIQLKLPYELAFMSTLGAKFLPILKDEFVDSLNSLMLRGIDIKKLKFKKKIGLYTYILTPVVSNSILKAKDLAIAMELRGFRIMNNRTSFFSLKLHKKDYVIMSISLAILIFGIIWRVLWKYFQFLE